MLACPRSAPSSSSPSSASAPRKPPPCLVRKVSELQGSAASSAALGRAMGLGSAFWIRPGRKSPRTVWAGGKAPGHRPPRGPGPLPTHARCAGRSQGLVEPLPSWRVPLAGRAGVALSLPASPIATRTWACHPPELGTWFRGLGRPEQAARPGGCGSHCCPRGSLLGGEGGRGQRAQVSRECRVGSSTEATQPQVPIPSMWGAIGLEDPTPSSTSQQAPHTQIPTHIRLPSPWAPGTAMSSGASSPAPELALVSAGEMAP